jgi:hypothetical protein
VKFGPDKQAAAVAIWLASAAARASLSYQIEMFAGGEASAYRNPFRFEGVVLKRKRRLGQRPSCHWSR